MSYEVAASLHKKSLQLIILPTEKCNFRCTYCYEDFEIGKMKRPTIDGIKNLISARVERDTLDHLNLSWFGGEPLLAKDVMFEIASFAKSLLDAGKIQTLTGEVTTNAYLLEPQVLAMLVSNQQKSYQISLDGFGEGHDKTRKYASGKGTFEKIWANLLSTRSTDLDFHITLRCHMTAANEESMHELVEHIAREFHGDKRFSVFFKPIENLGGPNTKSIKAVEYDLARKRVEVYRRMLVDSGLSVSAVIDGFESAGASSISAQQSTPAVDAQSYSKPESPPQSLAEKAKAFSGYICYASKPNSLMIRADGAIGKCTVLMSDPRNRVGEIRADGTLQLDSKLLNGVWLRGFTTMDPNELGCPAQNIGAPPPKEAVIKLADMRQA